jgi:hypothetical protein
VRLCNEVSAALPRMIPVTSTEQVISQLYEMPSCRYVAQVDHLNNTWNLDLDAPQLQWTSFQRRQGAEIADSRLRKFVRCNQASHQHLGTFCIDVSMRGHMLGHQVLTSHISLALMSIMATA